jgi:hypothetical protein
MHIENALEQSFTGKYRKGAEQKLGAFSVDRRIGTSSDENA